MRVTLALPRIRLEAGAVRRACDWVKTRFRVEDVRLMAPVASLAHYQLMGGAEQTQLYVRDIAAAESDILVFAMGDSVTAVADDVKAISGPRIYTMEKFGRLRLAANSIDTAESPALDKHIFNRLGPKSPDGEFYYFPYGYLFKCTGLGPINEFGYRIKGDFMRFADRDPSHKVIAVFGGSAAWSMYSLHHEMFATLLEDKLNAWSKAEGRGLSFSVLNFGMHGHVVMNEMIAHLLFSSRIKPDIVIAHDGFNDLVYGMYSDTDLLGQHDLTYQYNLENWSQALHQTQNLPTNQPQFPLSILNIPQAIAKAYAARKQQFRRLVEDGGAKFIWGLQPFLYSKKALSADEREYAASLKPESPFYSGYKRVPYLYEKFGDLIRLPNDVRFVSVHDYFSQFGESETLFGDMVHTLPEGDEKIADCYFDHVSDMVVQGA